VSKNTSKATELPMIADKIKIKSPKDYFPVLGFSFFIGVHRRSSAAKLFLTLFGVHRRLIFPGFP